MAIPWLLQRRETYNGNLPGCEGHLQTEKPEMEESPPLRGDLKVLKGQFGMAYASCLGG